MKRAVGRGPDAVGPGLFFRIGGGIMAGVFEVVDDDVVLGLLLSRLEIPAAREPPGA